MRSFFNKPEWATKASDPSNTGFYRRSGQTFSDIVAANREARRKQKLAVHSSESASPSPSDESRETKRPRKSDEHEDKSESENEKPEVTVTVADEADAETEVEPELAHPAQESEPEAKTRERTPSFAHPDLDSHVGSFQTSDGISRPASPQRPIYIDDSADEQLTPPMSHHTTDIKTTSVDSTTVHGQKDHKPSDSPTLSTMTTTNTTPLPLPTSPPVDDPRVHILITSEIPNTNPLIIQRKMSQALKDARLAWCERQGFTNQEKSTVYLTWQGRRVFDVTTCRSLNIKQEKKSLLDIDDEFDDEEPPSELQIHMVAVTQNPTLLNRRGPSPDAGAGAGAGGQDASPNTQTDAEHAPMKLLLRSPGLSDFKIKARPSTTVAKIVAAFREKQNISGDKSVDLIFDGDRLESDSCLGDHDVSDLDMLEVLIK
ncbi:Uncharacterized protein PECH_007223 [Penicillium ucsense]|uniref:Ubiquitin-like domain-containing protein n=1 Tax=Penicillium ucsense TaxID=2839758 RepID=A0A8J8VWL0_9EURO|nr:Uncharacterized protein PECM_001726 [Penicillium ucsense]KAF7735056.1 Uncharacterized protein PECH_007223 [Penicillium ucsense]